MLNKKELVKKVDSHLGAMIELVNIPNFTKCIAQYAGLQIKEVPDTVIEEYLITWAKNKHRFFNMLGNKLQLDMTIDYQNPETGLEHEATSLMKAYPAFAPWIGYFRGQKKNKIEDSYRLSWEARELISALFPNLNVAGTTMTHLFASYLNAPDDLVTAIGRAFEGGVVKGTWTLSIDPVDMMLASENPYDWNSCYRLCADNEASHADGCLAAILDDSSLISYIWSSEGDMSLYSHTLTDVRWKRIREWIAISPTMMSIHFNNIYPTKHSYGNDFEKQLRSYTEKIVSDYMGVRDSWKHNDGSACCEREYYYGYGEFSEDYIWCHSDSEKNESWTVYNYSIKCPCGCGCWMPGTEDNEYGDCAELNYNGQGLIYENFEERHWCDYVDDYCSSAWDRCDERCRGCSAWDDAHPYCDIAQEGGEGNYICEQPDYYYTDNGMMTACSGHCEGCPMWAAHHQHSDEERNREEETEREEVTVTGQAGTVTLRCDNDGLLGIRTSDITVDRVAAPYISFGNPALNTSITYDNDVLFTYTNNPYEWLVTNNEEITISRDMPSLPINEPASE